MVEKQGHRGWGAVRAGDTEGEWRRSRHSSTCGGRGHSRGVEEQEAQQHMWGKGAQQGSGGGVGIAAHVGGRGHSRGVEEQEAQ